MERQSGYPERLDGMLVRRALVRVYPTHRELAVFGYLPAVFALSVLYPYPRHTAPSSSLPLLCDTLTLGAQALPDTVSTSR